MSDSVTYEYPPVYKNSHLVVRDHLNEDDSDERVAVYVGREPMETSPTIVGARRLRDALNEYLDNRETVENTSDTSLTVNVDADVSAASEAIESLQTDMEALTEELNEAAERVEDIDIGSLDFGLPAPSPSDVQAELGDIESETEREMVPAVDGSGAAVGNGDSVKRVPAEPLYELAEMWAGVRVTEPYGDKRAKSYRKARKESGEWLKEELDELTGGDDA